MAIVERFKKAEILILTRNARCELFINRSVQFYSHRYRQFITLRWLPCIKSIVYQHRSCECQITSLWGWLVSSFKENMHVSETSDVAALKLRVTQIKSPSTIPFTLPKLKKIFPCFLDLEKSMEFNLYMRRLNSGNFGIFYPDGFYSNLNSSLQSA